MKLLCDQMLIRLGRWLRAAGYDTLIIDEPIEDPEIYRLARQEGRILITRDRRFGKESGVVYLASNEVESCAKELSQKLKINWLMRPFSRCLVCNTPFQKATEEDAVLLPPEVTWSAIDYSKCPRCKKIFWFGSHTHKMLKQLKKWATV